jgi:hypothetical protein
MDTKVVETTGDGPNADGRSPGKKRKRGLRGKACVKVAAETDDNGEGGEKEEEDGKNSNLTSDGQTGTTFWPGLSTSITFGLAVGPVGHSWR